MQDFEEGIVFTMTTDRVTLEFDLFDPATERYLRDISYTGQGRRDVPNVLPFPNCGVQYLKLVGPNNPAVNNSIFKIYTDDYFHIKIPCC